MKTFAVTSVMLVTVMTVALVAVAASPAVASVVTYTDEASFTAALDSGYYLEDFDGYDWAKITPPHDLSNGTYGYSVTAPHTLTGCPGMLSISHDNDAMQLTMTGDPVTAVGGLFFATNDDGDFVSGSSTLTVHFADDSEASYTVGVAEGDFFGVISTSPVAWMSLSETTDDLYATVDHIYAGAAVPEPGTLALLVAGLAGLLCYAWRKRK